MGEREYPIGKLRIKVNLRQLLDGYESLEQRRRQTLDGKELERDYGKGYEDVLDLAQRLADRPIVNTAEAISMSEGSKFTNNNQGANIGNLVNEAKDNAQVTASNFTQTSGANTAELLQLITNLRQTVAQLPADAQEDLIIDIDDVEEEIKKPEEKRNLPRLKKRLTALITAASLMASGVSAANDFADEVIEFGSKVGIELQLPSAP